MSVTIPRFEDGIPLAPGMPEVSDIGDVWLVHALASLLDACGVPEGRRAKLVASGSDSFKPRKVKRVVSDDETHLERLDSCRLAAAFAALAVEARLNRVLQAAKPDDWSTVAPLPAPEKFSLVSRLLDGPEHELAARELFPLAVELFEVRNELVGGRGAPASVLRLGPSRARAIVEGAARLCSFVAELADENESETARLAHRAAEALERRADALAEVKSANSPCPEPSGEVDFPPEIAEW
ncbi:MAG TPA: hypothetical protein VLV28_00985 [Gaiellaceae bacterium]|nr:hypothetical protein [Gaiellaceae bacterium]